MRIGPCTLLVLAAACGSGGEGSPGERPSAPDTNDAAYRVARVHDWYLIGNALTPGQDDIEVQVFAPEGTDTVDVWVDDLPGERLSHSDDGSFGIILDGSDLAAGEHEMLLAADGADVAFARLFLRRSHPLYVVVSTDWDDPDNSDESLDLQAGLHEDHAELKLTHFVGPYTFTDEAVSAERRGELADWVLGMRDDFGDEIGLHIHPWCSFVDTTDVECRTEPSTVYDEGDDTGYTVICAAYTEEEFTRLLEASDDLFEEAGLGKPTSFRAGGWTADLGTMRALAAAGYVADTSANNWQRMEEWTEPFSGNGVLWSWNMEHWATIDDTSQPYYPSEEDILAQDTPAVPVLEVPDNGILVDYVSGEEMIEIFDANWDGSPLAQPAAYSIGYHPPNCNVAYADRIDDALDHADRFLASQGAGPVVYATLSELVQVWPAP